MIKITQDSIDKFALASGGMGKIHTDADYARSSFYGKTIAHGLLVLALIEKELMAQYPDWDRGGRLETTFLKPVSPGDELRLELLPMEDGTFKVNVYSNTDLVVVGKTRMPSTH